MQNIVTLYFQMQTFCNGTVQTLYHHLHGPGFGQVGQFYDGNLTAHSPFLPNHNFGLNMRHIFIATYDVSTMNL